MVSRYVPQFHITFSRNLFLIYYYFDKISCKKIRILYQSFRQNTRVCNIVYNLFEKNPLVLLVLKSMNIQQREIYYIVVQLRPGSGLELTISGSNATGSEKPPFYPLGLLGIYIYINKILIVLQNGY